MPQKSYTIIDPEIVTEELNLSDTPTGLNILFEGNNEACTVETVPPVLESPLSVSNDLLQELLEDGHIELKD